MMNNALSSLTMCRRAGKMVLGMDPVKEAIAKRTLNIVIVASDLSEKSLKEIRFVCEKTGIKCFLLNASMDEIWSSLGKRSGILGICDSGFSKKLEQILKPLE